MAEDRENGDIIQLDQSLSTVDISQEDDDPLEFECLTLPEFDAEFLDDQDFRENHTSDVTVKRIPFSSIFENNNGEKKRFFLPGQKIYVKITDAVIPDRSRAFNPYVDLFNAGRIKVVEIRKILYVIQLEHGEYEWTIRRRWKHFRQLHEQLMLFRAKVNLMPTKQNQQRRKSFAARKQHLPAIPKRPDRLVDDMEERKQQLENYMSTLVRSPQYRNHPETLKFLEVSRLSFVNQLGDKGREGFVNKRPGGVRKTGCCTCINNRWPCSGWKDRWLVLKDTFVGYMLPETDELRYVMLMDRDFKVELLGRGVLNSIRITNCSRVLELFSWTHRKASEWKDSIEQAAATSGKDFIKPARMDSFAPERKDSPVKWFVDAAGFMSDVADALESAKEEIFITDWWLSPEVYLKRPYPECKKWRLDLILQRKAQLGVKVYVLLWKELPMAVGINSEYTKQALTNLHPNIRVLRDPDGFVNFWSHHEKIVCVDQKVAFVGGIDLCYGRWDTPLHRLTDLGAVTVMSPANEDEASPFVIPPAKPDPLPASKSSSFYHQDSVEVPGEDYVDTKQERSNTYHERTKTESVSSTKRGNNTKKFVRSASVPMSFKGPEDQVEAPPMSAFLPSRHSVVASKDVILEEEEDEEEEVFSEAVEEVVPDPKLPTEEGVDNDSFEMEETNSVRPNPQIIIGNGHAKTPAEKVNSAPSTAAAGSGKQKTLVKQQECIGGLKDAGQEPEVVLDSIAKVTDYMMNAGAGTSSTTSTSLSPTSPWSKVRQITMESMKGEPQAFADYLATVGADNQPDQTEELVAKMQRNMKFKETNSEESAETQAKKDAAKARFSKLQIQHILKSQGTIDMVMMEPKTDKLRRERQASPKPKSKFAQRAKELRTEMQLKVSRPSEQRAKYAQNRSLSLDVNKNLGVEMPVITKVDINAMLKHARDNPDSILERDSESKFWIGKDYTNFIFKDFVDLDNPFTDFIDRNETPRMPWHDISAVVYGKAARDVARHFIQRWNYTKRKKKKKIESYPLLVPKTYSRVFVPPSVYTDPRTVLCNVQVLRSASTWSAGISETEHSIYNAYMDCINNSQHYIYIENQFFISIEENLLVSNHIADALYKRIVRAHKEGAVFRVFVVLPLLPAFEGEIGTTTGTSIQAVTHWNYASICRGAQSLLGRLANVVNDPFKYISFYCLRNWGDILGTLKSELIYVHSKLLIVDDRRVIIGSANINDRSMLGDRDSEIAILVEDDIDDADAIRSVMNEEPYKAGRYAYTLRTALFREHLGADTATVMDPVSSKFYTDTWMKHAALNTSVFEKVFNCVPTDMARSFAQLRELQAQPLLSIEDPELARHQLEYVRGHLVLFPLHFLCEEHLQPAALSKEGMAPTFIWT